MTQATLQRTFGGMVGLTGNVEQRLFDKDGNAKPLFQENTLGTWVLNAIRKRWFYDDQHQAIDEHGQVKPGLLNYLGAYGLRIPLLMGRWQMYRLVTNGVTNTGHADVAGLINNTGAVTAFGQIGMGTGNTAFSATQTALVTEVTASGSGASGVHVLASGSTTASRVTTSVTNDTSQWVGTVSITGTIAVVESAVFNNNTNGDMLCRQVFSAINVVSGDSLQFTWKVANA